MRRLREIEGSIGARSASNAETRVDVRATLTRMRELEQLAVLACDENERLEQELIELRRTLSLAEAEIRTLRRRRLGLSPTGLDSAATRELPQPIDPPPARRRGLAIGAGLVLGFAVAAGGLYADSLRSMAMRMAVPWPIASERAPASLLASVAPPALPVAAEARAAIAVPSAPARSAPPAARPASLEPAPARRVSPRQRATKPAPAERIARCDGDPLCGLEL